MTTLRRLDQKEIQYITKDVKNQKLDIIRLLKSKVKVYKMTKTDLNSIKKYVEVLISNPNTPRYLEESELDYLTEVIPEVPTCISEIAKFNRERIVKRIRFDLSTMKICPRPETLKSLRFKLYESFMRSLCEPGESVGNNGAAGIGRLLTQMSLNSFHTAGSSSSTTVGIKTIEKLFNPNTKRNIVTATIHFKDKNLTKEEIFRTYTQKLRGVSVQTLTHYTEIRVSITPEDEKWYQNYEAIYSTNVSRSKVFLRIHVNTYRCYIYDIEIKDIVDMIEKTTRTESGKKSVRCVASPTFQGMIDVHAEPEFIRRTVEEFSTSGKTFRGCERKRLGGKKKDEMEFTTDERRTFLKTSFDSEGSLKDMSSIFLNIILEGCFKDMVMIGIKGIDYIRTVSEKMVSYLKFSRIYSDRDLEKYTSKPFNVKYDDFYRVFYIHIDYFALYVLGIPEEKFIKFFELCGIKIIERNFGNPDFNYCVGVMPEVPDEMYKTDDGKKVPRFEKRDGIVYDRKEDKEVVTSEEPTKLLSRKLEESSETLKETVRTTETVNFDFPEIYRYGYYCYAKATGSGMIQSILKDKLVDSRFTSSDNALEVYGMHGIEAARLFFIREYTSNDSIQKMNPTNIELLVDFQTAMGQLYSVTATDIAKHGKSALVAASFQQPIEAFRKAGAIGSEDKINNIPSCLFTGKKMPNGTGSVEVVFDDSYTDDSSNKVDENASARQIDTSEVTPREMLGSCFGSGKYVRKVDGDESEEEDESSMGMVPPQGGGEKGLPDIDLAEGDFDDELFDL